MHKLKWAAVAVGHWLLRPILERHAEYQSSDLRAQAMMQALRRERLARLALSEKVNQLSRDRIERDIELELSGWTNSQIESRALRSVK